MDLLWREAALLWREADRADDVAGLLTRIRIELDASYLDEVMDLIKEVLLSSQLLRDLCDLFRIYRERSYLIIDHTLMMMPSFKATLKDIRYAFGNMDFTFQQIWAKLQRDFSAGSGLSLRTRFHIYNNLLVSLVKLLTRPWTCELEVLELQIRRMFRLRSLHNIEGSTAIPQILLPAETGLVLRQRENPHWAENVFGGRHYAGRLKHLRASRCFGRPMPEAALNIPSGSRDLFKLQFDKNLLSVMGYLHPNGNARILCRWIDRDGTPAFESRGVHELCIRRIGSSLQFHRWSEQKLKPKVWMALFFKSWEKMVLFHDTFVSLKIRCPLTVRCSPDDFNLGHERKLFQGRIIDDQFHHVLMVWEDKSSLCLRLSATIQEGKLKRSPVWTAFITDVADSPRWARRKSPNIVWLRSLHPYIFTSQYREKNQRMRDGEYELFFLTEQSADQFMAVFDRNNLGG